jgi:RimJ/RimL family protein N-acetyltransferase
MPVLETERLRIRPFVMDDLEAAHHLLDHDAWQTGQTLAQREAWLRWAVLNYDALAGLYQPPYGDRALVQKSSGRLIGAVGLVPCLGPFGLLRALGGSPVDPGARRNVPEVGLFWAVASAHRGKGFATEAARALIDYAFTTLNLRRIVATTEFPNTASQAVMRRLGMRVESNPLAEPVWFQVAGVLENDRAV